MEHLDENDIITEINDISKRIQSIVETIKEFEPDPEESEDPNQAS
jgi:hypothetical protein